MKRKAKGSKARLNNRVTVCLSNDDIRALAEIALARGDTNDGGFYRSVDLIREAVTTLIERERDDINEDRGRYHRKPVTTTEIKPYTDPAQLAADLAALKAAVAEQVEASAGIVPEGFTIPRLTRPPQDQAEREVERMLWHLIEEPTASAGIVAEVTEVSEPQTQPDTVAAAVLPDGSIAEVVTSNPEVKDEWQRKTKDQTPQDIDRIVSGDGDNNTLPQVVRVEDWSA